AVLAPEALPTRPPADLAYKRVGDLLMHERARACAAELTRQVPARTEELRREVRYAVVARDIALVVERAERLPGAEHVLLDDPHTLETEPIVRPDPEVQAGAPLVARVHDHVPGAVRLARGEDVDAREEAVPAQ